MTRKYNSLNSAVTRVRRKRDSITNALHRPGEWLAMDEIKGKLAKGELVKIPK